MLASWAKRERRVSNIAWRVGPWDAHLLEDLRRSRPKKATGLVWSCLSRCLSRCWWRSTAADSSLIILANRNEIGAVRSVDRWGWCGHDSVANNNVHSPYSVAYEANAGTVPLWYGRNDWTMKEAERWFSWLWGTQLHPCTKYYENNAGNLALAHGWQKSPDAVREE